MQEKLSRDQITALKSYKRTNQALQLDQSPYQTCQDGSSDEKYAEERPSLESMKEQNLMFVYQNYHNF